MVAAAPLQTTSLGVDAAALGDRQAALQCLLLTRDRDIETESRSGGLTSLAVPAPILAVSSRNK
jgi:hypothetical protein